MYTVSFFHLEFYINTFSSYLCENYSSVLKLFIFLSDKMDKVVYNIIHMANMTESNKKVLLLKVLQSSASSNATLPQPQDKDVVAIFDTCLSLATVSSTHSSLASYAFGIWAERYKGIVRKYMTVEMVSGLLSHRTASPILVVAWLKDVLGHVPEDTVVSLLPVSGWTLKH